jgi:hypothetical protein
MSKVEGLEVLCSLGKLTSCSSRCSSLSMYSTHSGPSNHTSTAAA